MADFKISDLTSIGFGQVTDADRVIINNGPTNSAVTRAITMGDLKNIFGSSGGGIVEVFEPVCVDRLTDTLNQDKFKFGWAAEWGDKAPVTMFNEQVSLPMPGTANACLLFYQTSSTAVVKNELSGYLTPGQQWNHRSYLYHQVDIVNGGKFYRTVDGANATRFALNSTHNFSLAPRRASNGAWVGTLWNSWLPATKNSIISLNSPGSTVNLNCFTQVTAAGFSDVTSYVGRFIALPLLVTDINAFNSLISTALNTGADLYTDADDLDSLLFPEITPEGAAASAANYMTDAYYTLIRDIEIALEYYTNISSDPTAVSVLTAQLSAAYRLRMSTGTTEQIGNMLKTIIGLVAPYVEIDWHFTTNRQAGENYQWGG